jgi:nitrate/nitrite-specific signal transduction histidine kinase
MKMANALRDHLAPWDPRRSLRARIFLGNALVFFLLVVAGLIVLTQMRRLLGAVDTLQAARVNVAAAETVRHDTTTLLGTVTRLLPDQDAVGFSSEVAAALADLEASAQVLVRVGEATADADLAASVADVATQVQKVVNIGETMVRQASNDQWPNVQVRVALLNRDQQEVVGAVDRLLEHVQGREAQALAQVETARRSTILYPSLIIIFTVLFGGAVAWRLSRRVTQPVAHLMEGASLLASGSFSEPVVVRGDDELARLATAFNRMADDLQRSYSELEERVAARTRALETSLAVSRKLSTILDSDELVQAVVDEVQAAFGYYHAHIYLLDASGTDLVLVGGTGDPARKMLAQGHAIPAGKGVVGRAARFNRVWLVPDVAEDPGWLSNPLLPGTRAEVAVPIAYGEEVYGVLDVQHDVIGGLDDEDAALLQAIAAQVAVALQNARLLAAAQKRAERAALVNVIGRRIQRADSVEGVLSVAAEELGRLLQADGARVTLRAPLPGSGNGAREEQEG